MAKKKSKKYLEAAKKVEADKAYTANEAVALVKEIDFANFDATVEVAFNLNLDTKQADQQLRGALVLPNGTGKKIKILVICKGENEKLALEAGADYVGAEEMAQKIQSENWMDFDILITTPDMMSVVGRLGKILGPRGLMPNPKSGTVTTDVAKAVRDAKAGKIEYRLDKTNIIHCPIGKASFGKEKLNENFTALINAIANARPEATKGQYIKSCVVSSTMGPGIKINTSKWENA